MNKPPTMLDALRTLMKAVERCEDNDYSPASRAALAAAADAAAKLTAVSPAPTSEGLLMEPRVAMHRLQQTAHEIDRVTAAARTLHADDITALQAAWSVITGVVRNIDDETHGHGLG